MKLFRYILFIFPFLFISCDDKDEPYSDLFSIYVKLDEQGGEVQIIKHECEVTISGEQQYIHVTLSGNFDNLNLRPPYSSHDWSMVTIGEKTMSICVLKNNMGAVRNDNVDFVVSKGSVKNEGTISIVQRPN
ncbi:MAG: hypothetical protein NC212_08170 [Staphylococcus sp.]|nr:hypothetical protein [Staphylococcus sp.]